jgi:hypothetical protein
MKWLQKLLGNQIQQKGRVQPIIGLQEDGHDGESLALSAEQQEALCMGLQPLHIIASAAKVSHSGQTAQVEINQETARWAIPYAERIIDAVELFQRGDIQGALSISRSLPEAAIVQMNIGVCYAQLGERQQAESWFRKSAKAMPPSKRGMLEENLRRLQIPEASSISQSEWNSPPTHATCIACHKPIPFAQKDAPWGSAMICPHCHAPRLEYEKENPLPTSPRHCRIHFGMDGRGLEHPRCPYCNKLNYAIVFPAKGMNLAWFSVMEPENSAGYTIKVTCVNCAKEFYVEWDENPF